MEMSYGSCFISNPHLFEKLNEESLKSIADKSVVYTLSRKKTAFQEFPIEEKVYIVHEGKILLSYIDANGKKIILDILGTGSIFGDLNFASRQEKVYENLFVEAFPEAKICEIKKADFRSVIVGNPEFAISILSEVSGRLAQMSKKMGNLAFAGVERRLVAQIASLALEHGEEGADTIELRIRLTHEKLAEMIGAARETVSEAISKMKKQGVISQTEKKYIVLHKNMLDSLGE